MLNVWLRRSLTQILPSNPRFNRSSQCISDLRRRFPIHLCLGEIGHRDDRRGLHPLSAGIGVSTARPLSSKSTEERRACGEKKTRNEDVLVHCASLGCCAMLICDAESSRISISRALSSSSSAADTR
uniref:Uncharacterized protein n=1 Tax=Knipowitschia caucasica TaxID=637954 RepID=A0AAV2LF80_KNICA